MSTTPSVGKQPLYLSLVLSVPPVLLLVMSGVMKVMQVEEVTKGMADWPAGSAVTIGVIELACTLIYVIPRTAVLGAVLLAAYLGGAVAVNVHKATGLWWLPVLVSVALWGGLWLRDPRVRALLPLRA